MGAGEGYISKAQPTQTIAGYDFYPVKGTIGLYWFWGGCQKTREQIERIIKRYRL